MIPAVNYHLWEPCNMRCQFCFATFKDVKNSILPKGHLPREQSIDVVKNLAQFGFEKITFAGGEPTLCKWLPELIQTAKTAGLTTMIVTNGTNLTDDFLRNNQQHLDWITVSVDSLLDKTNIETGRAINGNKPVNQLSYFALVEKIKYFGYGLKINTVVNSKNVNENLSEFVEYANPSRWKIFQVLPIKGQNDLKINDLLISDSEFEKFINNHKTNIKDINIIPETNNQMKGSYVMVDPAGRFFDNSSGTHIYSKPISSVGCNSAFNEMNYDSKKFKDRGGLYNWERQNKLIA